MVDSSEKVLDKSSSLEFDWLTLQGRSFLVPFIGVLLEVKYLRYLPVFVFKVILIILSSTFMSCILQYSSTHRLQCIHCTD